MPKVIYNPGENGVPVITVEGVTGKNCTDVTEDLENDLGKVSDKKKTSEFFHKTEKKQEISN